MGIVELVAAAVIVSAPARLLANAFDQRNGRGE
jgi:hypothetical protein